MPLDRVTGQPIRWCPSNSSKPLTREASADPFFFTIGGYLPGDNTNPEFGAALSALQGRVGSCWRAPLRCGSSREHAPWA